MTVRRAALGLTLSAVTLAALGAFIGGGDARAQSLTRSRTGRPIAPLAPIAAPVDAGTAFRTHFGLELATNLMRDADPDERLRGIERASHLGGPEARLLLIQALAQNANGSSDALIGAARRDGRALLAATRALSRELLDEVSNPSSGRPGFDRRPPALPPSDSQDAGGSTGTPNADATQANLMVGTLLSVLGATTPAQPEFESLVWATAARALALSADPRAIEALVTQARTDGRMHDPAIAALRARASRDGAVDGLLPPLLSVPTVALCADVGDLRCIDGLTVTLRNADPRLRESALAALTQLEAPQSLAAARSLVKDVDAGVRLQAGRTLVHLGAPEAAAAVGTLLGDESTRGGACGFAGDVEDPGIARLLTQLAGRPGNDALRRAMIGALSMQRGPSAAQGLASLIADPVVASDAAASLARSRSPAASRLLDALATEKSGGAMRRLGVRALLLRALVHQLRDDENAALERSKALATSPDPIDRALYIQTHVALGALTVERGLDERDGSARAAAIMGSMARPGERTCRALSARRKVEPTPGVRTLLAIGFACERGIEGEPSSELWTRAREGGPDAPLSLMGLAARAHDGEPSEIFAWLGASDPRIRSHVARGLGESTRPDATGRLARALLYETVPAVRRVMIAALSKSAPPNHELAPSARDALMTLAAWDPEADVRALAERALRGESLIVATGTTAVAWLRLQSQSGAAPRLKPTSADFGELGLVERSDGMAIPIAFDGDGFAVVPGLPPGFVQLLLAPGGMSLQSSGPPRPATP